MRIRWSSNSYCSEQAQAAQSRRGRKLLLVSMSWRSVQRERPLHFIRRDTAPPLAQPRTLHYLPLTFPYRVYSYSYSSQESSVPIPSSARLPSPASPWSLCAPAPQAFPGFSIEQIVCPHLLTFFGTAEPYDLLQGLPLTLALRFSYRTLLALTPLIDYLATSTTSDLQQHGADSRNRRL